MSARDPRTGRYVRAADPLADLDVVVRATDTPGMLLVHASGGPVWLVDMTAPASAVASALRSQWRQLSQSVP